MIRSVALISGKTNREFNIRSTWITLLATMHYTGIKSNSSKIAFSVNQFNEKKDEKRALVYEVTDLESVIDIWVDDIDGCGPEDQRFPEYQVSVIKGGINALIKSTANIDRAELEIRQRNLENDIAKNGFLFKYMVADKVVSLSGIKIRVNIELVMDDKSEAIMAYLEKGEKRESYFLYRGEPSLLIDWMKKVKINKTDNGIFIEIPGRGISRAIEC